MKKILISIICIYLCFDTLYALSSKSYVVMEQSTNRVLYEDKKDEQMLIASTTKIMTALIACESDLDKVVTVTDAVTKSYGSGIYIKEGEEIKLRDLVYGLMLRSGNDAAMMIAEEVGGSQEGFALLMNEKAIQLGMKNSIFYNPSGLDEETQNLSTSYDMALLMSEAMQNEDFKKITGTYKHVVKTNLNTYVWYNKNRLLTQYEYATGGKTGYTERANRTLVTSSEKDGMGLVTVTLDDPNDFLNHENLYEQAYAEYSMYKVLNKGNIDVKEDKYYKDKLYIKNDYLYPIKEDEKDQINTTVTLAKIKDYTDETIVGYIDVYFGKEKVHREPIYVKGKTEKKKRFFWWFK